MQKFDVITIGDILIDTHVHIDDAALECDLLRKHCKLCLDYGSKIPITDSFQSLGGNATNISAGIKKLRLNTTIISAIGDDSNGQIILNALKEKGIPTNFVFIDKKNKTRYSVVLNFKGERTILSYSQKKNYSWPKNLPKTKWIYHTSLSQGFEKINSNLKKYLLKNPETKLAVNPGSFMIKFALDELRKINKITDLLVVNKEEAEKLIGLKKSNSIPSLVKALLKTGAKEVAITDADKGAWAGDKNEIWKIKSFPVKPISKTGAGDAFSSGYLSAKILNKKIPEALKWGVANACSVILKVGSQNGLLDKKGIKKQVDKYKEIEATKCS